MVDSELVQGYEAYVRGDDVLKKLSLKIDGVNCAACIQKIESKLSKESDVTYVRLNFTTGALSIEWDGDESRANNFVNMIISLGYKVHEYVISKDDEEKNNEKKFLLLCMGIAGFAMGNIMLLSLGLWITDIETMGAATRGYLHWISALIAIPTIIFCGRPFFNSALSALKNKRTNMDVPISLALILATGMSMHELVRGSEHVYFDSAVMLCFFLLIGRYLDVCARQNARSAALDLMSTLSGFATIIDGTKHKKIPIRDVREGMVVMVAVGEKFPIDGNVIKGKTSVDTSLVTGETLPRDIVKGDQVFAGTLNLTMPVTIKVAKAVEDSLLADIVRLMEKATQGQSKYTRIADRAAKLYTPLVHIFAILAFVGWWGFMDASWQDSLMISVTVLIITCPCALGLAVPVAQVLASSQLMKNKIMVKSGDALERLANIDTVFLDKTGTITMGTPTLIGDYKKQDLIMAASLAMHSNHPLSKAIVAGFDGSLKTIDDVNEIAGKGMSGHYKDKKIQLGSRAWCGDKTDNDDHLGPELWLNVEGKNPIRFIFLDQLKNDAIEIIALLKKQGLSTILLSGDRNDAVKLIASQIDVDVAIGEMTPLQKYDYLEKTKEKGHRILMIGDGLNDAPVLAGADVSMAPGSAIDMAQNAADIVFMGEDLQPVLRAYLIARKTQKIIKQNFTLAVIYNMFAVPLAFMGMVTPMFAAIAMSGSSIVVIVNSFRIRLKK